MHVCAQGVKRKEVALEKTEARSAKKATDDKRDPKLPTSVPLPKNVSEVSNVHVATLLADGVAAAAQPLTGGVASAEVDSARATTAAPPQPPVPQHEQPQQELPFPYRNQPPTLMRQRNTPPLGTQWLSKRH